MHRSTPWWLSTVAIVAVVGTACTSGSGSQASPTAAVSGSPAASTGSSAPAGVDTFSCPRAADVNALTAMAFAAAVGNSSDHCEYVVTSGSKEAARVTIDHPPASATSTDQTLAQFRAAIIAAGDVVLTTAPQYSADSFIAQFGKLSCSVFALARDGEVMQVQASHRSPATTDDCSLAQSLTALTGTASQAAAGASGSPAASPAPGSQVPASQVPASPSSAPPPSTPPAASTPPAESTTPKPSTPTTRPTTPRPTTAPTSPTEVLIFSTGPAASLTLPTARPTTR